MLDLSALRQEYTNAELNERDAHTQPFLQFEDWFLQAQKSEVPEPNAMVLATSDAHNQPHARVVGEGLGERGFATVSGKPKCLPCF